MIRTLILAALSVQMKQYIHPAPLESFSHFFYDCIVINGKIANICNDLLINNIVDKKIYCGIAFGSLS